MACKLVAKLLGFLFWFFLQILFRVAWIIYTTMPVVGHALVTLIFIVHLYVFYKQS